MADEVGEALALLGYDGDRLVAMAVFLAGFALNDHWRTVNGWMIHPGLQGGGHGRQLMREVDRVASVARWEAPSS
jgi:hypothetical protein